MSKQSPEYFRAYYQAHKAEISARKKAKWKTRKISGKLKADRARRRDWWKNLPPERKELEKQKRRDYWQNLPYEKKREIWARADQRQKEKDLRRYASKLKYDRAHPGRNKKYYKENADKMLARQKEYRLKQKAT